MRLRFLVTFCFLAAAFLFAAIESPQANKNSHPMLGGCGTVDGAFAEERCLRLSIEGEVSSGRTFEQPFGGNLRFRLDPQPALAGWFIEVVPERQPANGFAEYLWVVNPPYRSWNSRYLDTSYGWKAKDAVGESPRNFNFVVNEEQFKKASELVDIASMSRPQSDQRSKEEIAKEIADAEYALVSFPVAKGRLVILDSKVGAPNKNEELGTIEWLKFRVELRVPCDFAVLADSPKIAIDKSACSATPERKAN